MSYAQRERKRYWKQRAAELGAEVIALRETVDAIAVAVNRVRPAEQPQQQPKWEPTEMNEDRDYLLGPAEPSQPYFELYCDICHRGSGAGAPQWRSFLYETRPACETCGRPMYFVHTYPGVRRTP
jgi:hypothetical protein